MNNEQNKIFASFAKVSEIQQSDIYMTIKARLFEATAANLNGVRVTPEFIDEIVANQDAYIGLPLCADVENLIAGNYKDLGHMYDSDTGEFHSTQIGCFYSYEKEVLNSNHKQNNVSLIACARIMKRNKDVCKAINELFAEGSLKFSFEISCGEYEELEDGTIQINASENNHFEGAAIVSYPACENAVALDLVAAQQNIEGEETMNDVEQLTNDVNEIEQVSELNEAATETMTAEAENASAVAVEETVEQQEIVSEESAATEVAEKKSEDEDKKKSEDEEDEDNEDEETAGCKKKKKCAETDSCESSVDVKAEEAVQSSVSDSVAAFEEFKNLIASMTSTIEALRVEIAEIKKQNEQKAANVVASVSNPFMDQITMPEKKYSLLDPEEKTNSYSLLD